MSGDTLTRYRHARWQSAKEWAALCLETTLSIAAGGAEITIPLAAEVNSKTTTNVTIDQAIDTLRAYQAGLKQAIRETLAFENHDQEDPSEDVIARHCKALLLAAAPNALRSATRETNQRQ